MKRRRTVSANGHDFIAQSIDFKVDGRAVSVNGDQIATVSDRKPHVLFENRDPLIGDGEVGDGFINSLTLMLFGPKQQNGEWGVGIALSGGGGGVTLDTEQIITASKTWNQDQVFKGGISFPRYSGEFLLNSLKLESRTQGNGGLMLTGDGEKTIQFSKNIGTGTYTYINGQNDDSLYIYGGNGIWLDGTDVKIETSVIFYNTNNGFYFGGAPAEANWICIKPKTASYTPGQYDINIPFLSGDLLITGGAQTVSGSKTFSAPVTLTNTSKLDLAGHTGSDFTVDGDIGFMDINCNISVRGTGVNNPDFTTFRNGLSHYEFKGAPDGELTEVWCEVHIPHSYAPGTGIFLHAHYATNAALPSGNVKLSFEYSYASGDGVFPVTQTVSAISPLNTQYEHVISEISTPILAGSIEVDGILLVRVFRDPGDVQDTSINSIWLFFMDAHIQTNKLTTKYRNKASGSFYS